MNKKISSQKKSILNELNIFAQCRRHEIPLKQCPQFLFIIMGIVIVGSILLVYIMGIRYVIDPFSVILIVLVSTSILFIIAFIISHSFEKLAEANRMKTEFVDIVSHQLRTPLASLKWTIELLMTEKSIMKKQEYFQILEESSDRMQDLISDLLIASKIMQGSFPLRKKEVVLEPFFKEIISHFDSFAQMYNIKMKVEIQEKLPKIFIDPSQIKIVIENLVENAIRYSNKKGEIKILLGKKENDIYFRIKDEGIGIPEEDKKYIFKKFFRAKNILRYQARGNGLGLFISKSIIRNSGGNIGFISQEDVGSTFWFTLPIST